MSKRDNAVLPIIILITFGVLMGAYSGGIFGGIIAIGSLILGGYIYGQIDA